jgi:hypothetical protein
MLFIDNKYTHWYYKIVNQAKARNISSYTERHHIIPKSFGGSNKKENLVRLTPREHYICHLLLTKMVSGEYRAKMIYALSLIKPKVNHNSTLYEKLKIEGNKARSIYMTDRVVSIETRTKQSNSRKGKYTGTDNHFYGKTHSAESRAKIADRDYSLITGGNNVKSKQVCINGQVFDSINTAVRTLGIPQSTIADVLKGRCKNSKRVWEAIYLPYPQT